MTKKKRLSVKTAKIKKLLKKERKEVKRDFFELIKRAAMPVKS